MITKGIVEEIVTQYKVKVRAPILDRVVSVGLSTAPNDLNDAIICTLPNCDINLHIGDVVFIGFEDNDYSKPIILGTLYRSAVTETYCDLILATLSVNAAASLPSNTTVGTVSPENIKCLEGVKSNIQSQLDNINNKLDYLLKHHI